MKPQSNPPSNMQHRFFSIFTGRPAAPTDHTSSAGVIEHHRPAPADGLTPSLLADSLRPPVNK